MENFYITLPSNVKNNFYNNTVANFKTKLANRVELEGEWECGLASISYTRSWNLKTEYGKIIVYYSDGPGSNFEPGIKAVDSQVSIDIGKYTKVEDLVLDLNSTLKTIGDSIDIAFPRFEINKETGKIEIFLSLHKQAPVTLDISSNLCRILGINKSKLGAYNWSFYKKIHDNFYSLSISEQMQRIFQFMPEPPDPKELVYIAEEPFNILPTFQTLFVYCDVIKYISVGNELAQLLRVVEVPSSSKFRDQIQINYPHIHYHPILNKNFDEIEIDIKDDLGENIPFLFGRSIITLHFRKIQ